MNRRSFLVTSVQLAAGMLLPYPAFAGKKPSNRLSFYHTHTGERMDIEYMPGKYGGSVRRAFEYFLRDFRTGERHKIDPGLLDTLFSLQNCCGSNGTYEIISGYRSAETNALLRKKSWGVAKKSLHMQGRAVDVRLTGLSTKVLRDLALNLHDGGVGYYPGSDFVHIDTGRKRNW